MAKKPAKAKRKPAKKAKAKKPAVKAARSSKKQSADKTTIKLASDDAVKKFGDSLKRLKSDAQGVSGDMSALKTKIAEAHGHYRAIKIALDIAGLSDAKIAMLLPHLDQAFTVFEVYKRGNLQLEMFAQNVLRDAKAAAEAAEKAATQTAAQAKSRTTSLAKPLSPADVKAAADRAEKSSLDRVGRGKAADAASDGQVPLNDIDKIKQKMAEGSFVTQAEREKLADFDSAQAGPSTEPPQPSTTH